MRLRAMRWGIVVTFAAVAITLNALQFARVLTVPTETPVSSYFYTICGIVTAVVFFVFGWCLRKRVKAGETLLINVMKRASVVKIERVTFFGAILFLVRGVLVYVTNEIMDRAWPDQQDLIFVAFYVIVDFIGLTGLMLGLRPGPPTAKSAKAGVRVRIGGRVPVV